jgi:hypothetical protein
MPLVTWEDFQAATPADALGPQPVTGTHVYETAQFRLSDDSAPMPQPPNPRLDATEMATMNAWLSAGAPKSDGSACTADASAILAPDAGPPALDCSANAVTVSPPSPWAMPQDEEDVYVCYSVPVPLFGDAGTNHVIAITPNVDNHRIVHHVLLYQSDTPDPTVTSTPSPCPSGGAVAWRIVYGWAPGGGSMQTPPDVGFPYDSTTQWIVQVHYNNALGLSGQTDSSGFSFCSTDAPVKYDADVVAFGTTNISIPPMSSLDTTCDWTVPSLLAGAHTFAAFPHMHQLGVGIQTEEVATGGALTGMAENVPWNFNAQVWFPLEGTLAQGDVVRTRCAWQNTTSSTVTFGPYTENEMCYSFTAYYPKIEAADWTWSLPAVKSICGASVDGGLPAPPGGWAIGPGFGANGPDGGS